MESSTHASRTDSSSGLPVAPPQKREEDSGLYDIVELAESTKKRITRQSTTQSDVEESLLASASALSSVALPTPGKERKVLPTTAEQAGTSAVAGPSATVRAESERRSGVGRWLLALVLVGAGAGAFYFFYVLDGQLPGQSTSASPNAAVARGDAPAVPAAAGQTGMASDRLEAEIPTAPEMDSMAAMDPPAAEEAVEAAAADDESTRAGEPRARSRSRNDKRTDQGDKSDSAAAATEAADKGSAETADKGEAAPAATAKAAPAGDQGASLEQLLDELESDDGRSKAKVVEEKKEPTKESLDRSDVSKAMGKISGAVASCHAAESFTGTVTVKFTVDPDGKVSKASATGSHKSSETGKCVVGKVLKAKFPSYSGRATSFTYPFLLAE